jgi:DNA-binding transcriptional MocR family regulator
MFEIEINRDADQTLYRQIFEQIKAEILQDRYTPDTKLPSIRKLAARLNVNNETVVKAYNLLAEESLIYKKEGSGSYIAPAANYKSSKDDQRLRILTSKKSTANNIIDFSGSLSGREYLKEFAFDLIFDRLYAEIGSRIFSELNKEDNQWYKLINEMQSSYSHQGIYFNSDNELKNILANLINKDDLILFEYPEDIGPFDFLLENNSNNYKPQRNNILKIESPDYGTLMDYLQENKIDYLILSDEPVFANILDWNFSKLNSLLELAEMLKFKIIILESYHLYEKNDKLESLMESKFKNNLILIRKLTDKIFPGLHLGMFFINNPSEKLEKSHLAELSLKNKFKLPSSGDNLLYNMLSYYIKSSYLKKRIKLLKQRFKNRNLLLIEEFQKYFKNIKITKEEPIFFTEVLLENKIDHEEFKVFAEKNGILLPDYQKFLVDKNNNKMIISAACLDQFSIRQGIMNLANLFRQYNN